MKYETKHLLKIKYNKRIVFKWRNEDSHTAPAQIEIEQLLLIKLE